MSRSMEESIGKRLARAEQKKEYRKSHPFTDEQKARDAKRQKVRRLRANEEKEQARAHCEDLERKNARLKQMVASLEETVYDQQNQLEQCYSWLSELLKTRELYEKRLQEDEELKLHRWTHWQENPFVQQVKMNAVRCKEAIGYSWDEFLTLLEEFGPLIQKCRVGAFLEKTWELSHSSRNSVHPTDLLLFVTLFWCKTGLSEGLISSFLAPVHQRDVIHFVLQTLHACGPALRREIQFPDPAEQERLVEEFNKMHSAQFAGFTAAVDGTETKVRRGYELPEEGQSKGPRENEYSVKKKQPSICWTVIVLLNGIIVKLSKATWNHNDQAQWNSEQMRDLFVPKKMGVFGDSAYTFNPKGLLADGAPEILGARPVARPNKKARAGGAHMSPQDKSSNLDLSRSRVVVENVYAQLKHWSVLAHLPVKGSDDYKKAFMDLLLDFLVPLKNRQIKASPLRKADWLHPSQRSQDP